MMMAMSTRRSILHDFGDEIGLHTFSQAGTTSIRSYRRANASGNVVVAAREHVTLEHLSRRYFPISDTEGERRLTDCRGLLPPVQQAEMPAPESLLVQLHSAQAVQFDRVLVDAPCSGTGVLGKRSDLRWHRRPSDVAELVQLQVRDHQHVMKPPNTVFAS
jgi:hypothetical protein